MAHATEQVKAGREPVWFVELDLDLCQEVFSVPPCTAVLAGPGLECFNTRKTCQDPANYNPAAQTYIFCENRAGIPVTSGAIPCVESVSIAPTKITVGRGLGERASVSVTFRDFPHHDRGIDPYVATRTYTPEDQGTFWRKLRVRNPFYHGREMRIKSGYIGDPFDYAADFVTRTYVIDRISGPDASGKVTVTGKDPLKLADGDRAQAPVANTGFLDAGIAAGAGAATLAPVGIGNTEYAAAGTIRIGEECMTFTRAADALTLTVRGTDGTTAAAHVADDAIQECLRYPASEIDDVITDLLVNYAAVPAAYITAADWQQEVDDWMSGHQATALITEPTSVRDLVNEICEVYMVDLWWDERDSEIKFKVLSPPTGTLPDLTDANALVADSVAIMADPKARRTQIWVFYGVVNAVESITDDTNFTTLQVYRDVDAETSDEYGDVRVQKLYSRWFTTTGDALRLGSRMLSRLRDDPRTIKLTLDAKDSTLWTGEYAEMTSDRLVDDFGAAKPTIVFITETREIAGGHAYAYTALESQFKDRYWRIGPNALPDYDDATDVQRQKYGWVSENAAPQLNGDGPYLIV